MSTAETSLGIAGGLRACVRRDPGTLQVYPRLMKHVAIKVVELQDHVLGTYDRAISDFTRGEFERWGDSSQAFLLLENLYWEHNIHGLRFAGQPVTDTFDPRLHLGTPPPPSREREIISAGLKTARRWRGAQAVCSARRNMLANESLHETSVCRSGIQLVLNSKVQAVVSHTSLHPQQFTCCKFRRRRKYYNIPATSG